MDIVLKASGYFQMYFKTENNDGKKERLMIIALYDSDMALATNDKAMLENEKDLLKERFEMEDKGEIQVCLGMSITRDRASKILMINQRACMENVLKRFHMFHCKPVPTPNGNRKKIRQTNDGENTTNQKKYQAAKEFLIYAKIATRPDKSFAVGVLSQFMSFPRQEHLKELKESCVI